LCGATDYDLENAMTTMTAGLTLAQLLRIELRRFLDTILKAAASDASDERFHWGRGL
jgi:hypothetical protein